MRIRSLLALSIGVALGVGVSLGAGVLAQRSVAEPSLPWQEARLLAEVLERVKTEYVEEVDEGELIEGAIRGMIAELDPHSAFLDSEDFREIRISTTGNYSGVGLEVNLVEGLVRVVSPIDGTPAQRAGVLPGDVIVMIDSVPVDDQNLNDTVARMRGEPGTSVFLSVQREGVEDLLDFELQRARIQVASVRGQLLEEDYGYVRLSQFSETTARDLNRVVSALHAENGRPLKGLVLDLRNNPGGVLDAAVAVSDAFLERGLIVSAEGRVEDAQFSMEARPGDLMDGGDVIVLVNHGSASASEIVAGALRDHRRATVMGTTTYGKGSVQTVMPLSDGRAIKLTTSRYYTPSGESIHGSGIAPDIELDDESSETPFVAAGRIDGETLLERDAVLRQALDRMRETAIVRAP